MEALEPTGPNAEQIKFWNDARATRWVALQERIDGHIGPLGLRAMDAAAIAPGERVLDVGCGCGSTTLEIARRVGPSGAVIGLDISAAQLHRARQRACDAGVMHAQFESADAQTHRLPPHSFDALFSRFGVMFFSDPQSAFANLRAGVRPGGRLGFVCWQGLKQNPWALVPLMAAAQHVPRPPPPAPGAPGPFAFADADRVRSLLSGAGFERVQLEAVETALTVGGGGDLDQAVDFAMQVGPTGGVVSEADAPTRAKVAGAVREALIPFQTADGVKMQAAAWIVTARRP